MIALINKIAYFIGYQNGYSSGMVKTYIHLSEENSRLKKELSDIKKNGGLHNG